MNTQAIRELIEAAQGQRPADLVLRGERSAETLWSAVAPLFDAVQLEYFSIVDTEILSPVEHIEGPVLIAGAIWLGTTRLIDNLTVAP